MNKTFTINLGGYPFTIDDDAYAILSEYLTTLRQAFKYTPDGSEVVNDIESRIAEIMLADSTDGVRIINAHMVEQVIERMGRPQQMVDVDTNAREAEAVNEATHQGPPPPPSGTVEPPKVKKRLYRNLADKLVGGVCSGLAVYFGLDVTWMRLIWMGIALIALFNHWFFISFGTVTLIYAVLWIVMPAARTPLEQMQMNAKEPTIENIGKTVTDFFRKNDDSLQQSGHVFFTVVAFIFKIFLILLAIALGIGALCVVLAVANNIVNGIAQAKWSTNHDWGLLEIAMMTAWSIVAIIPVALIVRLVMKSVLKIGKLHWGWKLGLWIVWLAALLGGITATITAIKQTWDDNFNMTTNSGVYYYTPSPQVVEQTDTLTPPAEISKTTEAPDL